MDKYLRNDTKKDKYLLKKKDANEDDYEKYLKNDINELNQDEDDLNDIQEYNEKNFIMKNDDDGDINNNEKQILKKEEENIHIDITENINISNKNDNYSFPLTIRKKTIEVIKTEVIDNDEAIIENNENEEDCLTNYINYENVYLNEGKIKQHVSNSI